MEKIKLTDEQVNFLKLFARIVNDGENDYYYMPFWMKDTGGNIYEVLDFANLPLQLIELLKDIRQ